MASPRIAIIIYSMYGHIAKSTFLFIITCKKSLILHAWIHSGRECEIWHRSQRWKRWYTPVSSIDKSLVLLLIKSLFFDFCSYRVPETLSVEILNKMHAVKKKDFPIAKRETLTQYDAFLFGVPTRFGNMPAQIKVRYFCIHLCVYVFIRIPLWTGILG